MAAIFGRRSLPTVSPTVPLQTGTTVEAWSLKFGQLFDLDAMGADELAPTFAFAVKPLGKIGRGASVGGESLAVPLATEGCILQDLRERLLHLRDDRLARGFGCEKSGKDVSVVGGNTALNE